MKSKHIFDLVLILAIGYICLFATVFSGFLIQDFTNKKHQTDTIFWQKLQYEKRWQDGSDEGPRDKDFYWNEIPSSKSFYSEMQIRCYGDKKYVVHNFSCKIGMRIYNGYTNDLILEMINKCPGLNDHQLLREFKIGLGLLLEEYKKRGVTVTPIGTPQTYRPQITYMERFICCILIGLFSIPGGILLWIYILVRERNNSNSNNRLQRMPAEP